MGLELVLGAVAITLLFVLGSIFDPLREHGPKLWRDLVSCPLCLGFWFGVGTALLFKGRPHDLQGLWVLIAAGAVSAFVALICKQVSGLLTELSYLVDQLSQNVKLTREQQEIQAENLREALRARAAANAPCAEHECPKYMCERYHRLEKLHGSEPEQPEQPAQPPR